MTPAALAILETLVEDFAVHFDNTRKQHELAKRCARGGMTEGDARVLAEWFADVERRRGTDKISKIVHDTLNRKAVWSKLLPEARRFVDDRANRAMTPATADDNEVPDPAADPAPVRQDERPEFLRHRGPVGGKRQVRARRDIDD